MRVGMYSAKEYEDVCDCVFFFFKQKTAYEMRISDWSSDVCSTDLNKFREIAFEHRYGKVYNRNLPKWYRRDLDSRIPIVPSADNIHLFIAGGEAGRFSAFIPDWGHLTNPVLRPISGATVAPGPLCLDGTGFLCGKGRPYPPWFVWRNHSRP